MNTEQVKDVLAAIGYPVEGDDLITVLDDLHDTYNPQVVGSSVRYLGDAEPLYVKAGQVAFLVDNEQDLLTACVRIRSVLKQREAAQPVKLEGEKRSQRINDIARTINHEVSVAEKVNRDLSSVHGSYLIEIADGRKWLRNQSQLMDDLLAADPKRNQRACQALRTLFIYNR